VRAPTCESRQALLRLAMLWVDKHRPKKLDDLDYHSDQAQALKRMVGAGDLPHTLLYGPSGAGKKTRIMCMLREVHGASVERLKVEQRTFKRPNGGQDIELTIVSSNHHLEFNPSDAGIRDREVVQEVIKEVASNGPVLVGGANDGKPKYKVIVLNEVERMSKPAQHALRRTMEKYVASCRLILCCTNPSKVIAPIRSRCVCLRVAAPSQDEICSVLTTVAKKEGLRLPPPLAVRIAQASQRNLRRAILTLEACKVQQMPLTETQPVELPDWQIFLGGVADDVIQEQSPRRLLAVRGKLYEIFANCIPAELIMRTLVQALLAKTPPPVGMEALHFATVYEHRMQAGSKPIFHIEAFLARFMSIYKKFAVQHFGK